MDLKKRRAMRAIRQIATTTPDDTIDDRLLMIAGLAVGEIEPSEVRKPVDVDAMVRCVKRARGDQIDEPAQERKQRGGRDRKHRGGMDRAAV